MVTFQISGVTERADSRYGSPEHHLKAGGRDSDSRDVSCRSKHSDAQNAAGLSHLPVTRSHRTAGLLLFRHQLQRQLSKILHAMKRRRIGIMLVRRVDARACDDG